jgi:hypothetical protein
LASPQQPPIPEQSEADRPAELQRVSAVLEAQGGPDPYKAAAPPPSPGASFPLNAKAPAQMVQDLHSLGEKLYEKYVRPDWTLPIDQIKAKAEADYQRGIGGKLRDLSAYSEDLGLQAFSLGTKSFSSLNPEGEKARASESFRQHNPIVPGLLELAGEVGNAQMGIHGMGGAIPAGRPKGLTAAAQPDAAPRVGLAEAARQAQPLAEGEALPMPQAAPFRRGRGIESVPPYSEWKAGGGLADAGVPPEGRVAARAAAADQENVWGTPEMRKERAIKREQNQDVLAAAQEEGVDIPQAALSMPSQYLSAALPGSSGRFALSAARRRVADAGERVAAGFGGDEVGPADLGAGLIKSARDYERQANVVQSEMAEKAADLTGSSRTLADMGDLATKAIDAREAMEVGRAKREASNFAETLGTPRDQASLGAQVQAGIEGQLRPTKAGAYDVMEKMTQPELRGVIADSSGKYSVKDKVNATYRMARTILPERMSTGGPVAAGNSRMLGGMGETLEQALQMSEKNQGLFSRTVAGEKQPGIDVQYGLPAEQQPGMGKGNAARVKNVSDAALPVKGNSPLGRFMYSLVRSNWRGDLSDMMYARSLMRREVLETMRPEDVGTLNEANLQRLQSAMTRDINNLMDRNRDFYAASPKQTFEVMYDGKKTSMRGSEIAARLDQAKELYLQGDNLTRVSKEQAAGVRRIFGTESPEATARAIFRAATEGSQNLGQLQALKGILKPGDWRDVVASLVHHMMTSKEGQFSPQELAKNTSQMPGPVKQILFGERAATLDDIAARFSPDRAAQFDAMRAGGSSVESFGAKVMRAATNGGQANITWLRHIMDTAGTMANELKAGFFNNLGRTPEGDFSQPLFEKNLARLSPDARSLMLTPDLIRSANEMIATWPREALDTLHRITNAGNTESAARAVVQAAKGKGQGNIALLRHLKEALPIDQWSTLTTFLWRNLSEPGKGATRATKDLGHSPEAFSANWSAMSNEAKALLFDNPALKRNIDNTVKLSDALKNVAEHENTSKSAVHGANLGMMGMAGAAVTEGIVGAFTGHGNALTTMADVMGAAAGPYVMSYLMSSPRYSRFLNRSIELSGKNRTVLTLRTYANDIARTAARISDPLERQMGMQAAAALMRSAGEVAARAGAAYGSPALAALGAGSASRDTASGAQPANDKTTAGRPSRNLPVTAPYRQGPVLRQPGR